MIDGELVTLPPRKMESCPPDLAKAIFDANFDNGVNALKRVAIEEDEYRQYSLFDDVLPERNWNLEGVIAEAVATGLYDDSFDESSLDEDSDDEDED